MSKYIVLLMFILYSCKGYEINNNNEEIVFTSFSVKDVSNNEIYMLDVDLKNNRINSNGLLPYEFDLTKLIITYTLNTDQSDIEVRLNGVSQISGESLNDFTEPKVYEIYRSGDLVSTFECKALEKNELATLNPYEPDGFGVPENHVIEGGYKLIWHDEFNYLGKPNDKMWGMEYGFCRNHEDQWYQKDNANIVGNELVITAKKEKFRNPKYNPNATGDNAWKFTREYVEYTSASLVARKEYDFKYGKVFVRAKIPAVQGAWPAIWSTGNKYEWPLGGEIDIMEYYKNGVLANACWGGNSRWSATWDSSFKPISYFIEKDEEWKEKYHIWEMVWDEDFIKLYIDNDLLNSIDLSKTKNKGDHGASGGGDINPFSNDIEGFGQRMRLNLAIGGDNGRPITAKFPFEYCIDYIRVYQK